MEVVVVSSMTQYVWGSTLGILYDRVTKSLLARAPDGQPGLLYRMVIELLSIGINVMGIILTAYLFPKMPEIPFIMFQFGLFFHQPELTRNVEIISDNLLRMIF